MGTAPSPVKSGWAPTRVFDALDTDHDGCLKPEEIRSALGAPLALSAR